MTAIIEAAKAFMAQVKDASREAFRAAYDALGPEIRTEYRRLSKAEFFKPEKADLEKRKEHLSPSGKYKLLITPFKTGEKTWGYTQGLVFKIGSDTPIAEVQRNYSSFQFCWVEDHPKGDFLVCGEDYQGQTVIELGSGQRRDFLPDAANKGHGFCWVRYKFESASQLMVVDGCFWACPYEFRFYDFSKPMEGWPEIESDDTIDADDMQPTFELDGTIKCYQTYEEDSPPEDETTEQRELAAIKTYRREGQKLVLLGEWVSEAEAQRRQDRTDAQIRFENWQDTFCSSDPLYLVSKELMGDSALSPSGHPGIGQTYEGWCSSFQGKEKRWCQRIVKRDKLTVDLEWAVDTGPIKLVIYRNGNHAEDRFFPHSPEAMREAFAYVKELCRG